MFNFIFSIVLLIAGIVKTEWMLVVAAGLFAIASSIFWSILILADKFKEKDGEK